MGIIPGLADIENPRQRRAIFWGSSVLLTAGAAVVYHWNPETTRVFPVCPIYALTGRYCPGCGMTRALHQLLHGNVNAALHYNPLLLVSVPLLCYWGISQVAFVFFGRSLPQIRVPDKMLWATLALVVLFGVVRNFSFYPFTLLAPR